MRIYEGSPRQDFEEVFRSIGAFLDSRGMRDILVVGWVVDASGLGVIQGAIGHALAFGTWRSLQRDQGLALDQAVDLMAAFVSGGRSVLVERLPETQSAGARPRERRRDA